MRRVLHGRVFFFQLLEKRNFQPHNVTKGRKKRMAVVKIYLRCRAGMPYLAYDGIKNEYGCFDRKSFRKPLNGLVVAECSLGDEFALSQYQITDELAKASGRTKGEAETDVGRGKDTATEAKAVKPLAAPCAISDLCVYRLGGRELWVDQITKASSDVSVGKISVEKEGGGREWAFAAVVSLTPEELAPLLNGKASLILTRNGIKSRIPSSDPS
jgi:hypothetical protein